MTSVAHKTKARRLPIQAATGLFRIGERHEEVIPINNTIINTGHPLTQAPGSILKIKFQDGTGNHQWQEFDISVDDLIDRFNSDALVDQSLTIFDNDYIQVHVTTLEDLAKGMLRFVDVGRPMAYAWSELLVWASPQSVAFLPSADVTNYRDTAGDIFEVTRYSSEQSTIFNTRSANGVYKRYNELPGDWLVV